MSYTVHRDDVVAWLRGREWLAQNGHAPRYHAVLCDPPYFLGSIVKRFGAIGAAEASTPIGQRMARGFMGQTWDGFESPWHYQAWVTDWATLLLSHVYPGAVLLAFGGTRTYHRLASGLEDAGWGVCDSLIYLYGSGFPKGKNYLALPEAWHGHNIALKPAYEPVVLARAPRASHTFAALARAFGTGAINVDGARVKTNGDSPKEWVTPRGGIWTTDSSATSERVDNPAGRWPANVILDEHAAAALDAQSGESVSTGGRIGNKDGGIAVPGGRWEKGDPGYGDSGGASRYFYCAKAAAWEREAGLSKRSPHPTVKPIALTEYLARLILPPALDEPRRLLVPFAGSGSEMIGALLAGWDVVTGIEQSPEYVALAEARLAWWARFGSYEQARAAWDAEQGEQARREAERAAGVEQLSLAFANEGGTI